jgi:hypothetical protein
VVFENFDLTVWNECRETNFDVLWRYHLCYRNVIVNFVEFPINLKVCIDEVVPLIDCFEVDSVWARTLFEPVCPAMYEPFVTQARYASKREELKSSIPKI